MGEEEGGRGRKGMKYTSITMEHVLFFSCKKKWGTKKKKKIEFFHHLFLLFFPFLNGLWCIEIDKEGGR
jgi:hypothetical protein